MTRRNRRPGRALFLLMLCLCLLAGPAQALDPGKAFRHYVRDTWSVQEGLPQSVVIAIAQTPDGYIWVGTQAGLGRFDGVGFTSFSPSNEPALPNPVVMSLAVGDDGALWIGTRSGLAVYRDGHFQGVPFGEDDEEVFIYALHASGDGRIWAATQSGVAHVDNGRLELLPGDMSAIAVAVDSDGALWAGQRGAARWDGRQWSEITQPDGSPATWVTGLLGVGDEVWAATRSGLYVRRASIWQPVPGAAGADALPLHFVYRDRDGNTWAGGDLGLVRVRPDGDVDTIRATRTNGLSNLVTAFEDREGNLWLGSQGNGLTRIRNGWTRRYSIEQGLPHAAAWTVAPTPGGDGVLVGTSNGLARLDASGRFIPVASGAGASDPVIALFPSRNAVWVGRSNTGLELYEPGSGDVTSKPEWAGDIFGSIMGFSHDADGNTWIGSMASLRRWDGTALEEFDATRGLVGTLVEPRLVTLRDGRRLVITENGLLEFDGHAFRPAAEAADLPDGVNLHGLVELSDGRLLLTELDGPWLLRHEGRWHRLDEAAGLPPGVAFQIIERGDMLWVSSSSVYGLKVEELAAVAEGHIDRLQPEALVDESGLSSGSQLDACCSGSPGPHDGFIADDTFWVPTSDGLLAVDLDDVVRNPHPPEVHVGRVRVGEQWRSLPADASTAFQADERDLTLAFDVLSFQDPRSNQARYRLVGYEQQGRLADPMVREIRYTNLPPGNYAFEVMGSNNANVWSGEPARLAFSIRPHFHETLAFRLLLATLAGLLVYAGYRYQRHRYRLRQAQLEALVGERTEALAESNEQLARTITSLEEANVTDPLTGLRNRRYLTQQLPADLNYYDRERANTPPRDEAVVFAMLDLDHFKQVNDGHGHATGDRVLEEAARRLKALVRAGDYVVRWGGEEFLLVLRPMPSEQVPVMGERLRAAIADTPFDIGDGRSLELTTSVGLSEYPLFRRAGQPLDWEAMVELADQALYYVKRHGRNGWAMFRPTPSTRLEGLLSELQRDPDALVRAGELDLVGSIAAAADRD